MVSSCEEPGRYTIHPAPVQGCTPAARFRLVSTACFPADPIIRTILPDTDVWSCVDDLLDPEPFFLGHDRLMTAFYNLAVLFGNQIDGIRPDELLVCLADGKHLRASL